MSTRPIDRVKLKEAAASGEDIFAKAAQMALDELRFHPEKKGVVRAVVRKYLFREKHTRNEGCQFWIVAVRWSDEEKRRNPRLGGCHVVPVILE